MKTIEVIIGPKGEAKVQTRGFTGGECKEASRFVEEALGQRTAEQLTGEFYQQGQKASQNLRQSN